MDSLGIRKTYLIPIKKLVLDIRKGSILRTYYVRPEYLEELRKKFLGEIGKPIIRYIPNLEEVENAIVGGNPQPILEKLYQLWELSEQDKIEVISEVINRHNFEPYILDNDIYLQDLLVSILGFVLTLDKKYVSKLKSLYGKIGKSNDYVIIRWEKLIPIYKTIKVSGYKVGGRDYAQLWINGASSKLITKKNQILIEGINQAVKLRKFTKTKKVLEGYEKEVNYKVVAVNNPKVVGHYLSNFLAFYNPHFTKLEYIFQKFGGNDYLDETRILVNIKYPFGSWALSPTEVGKILLMNNLNFFNNEYVGLLQYFALIDKKVKKSKLLDFLKPIEKYVVYNPQLPLKVFLKQYNLENVLWNAILLSNKFPTDFHKWVALPTAFMEEITHFRDFTQLGIKRIIEGCYPTDLKALYIALLPNKVLFNNLKWLLEVYRDNPQLHKFVWLGILLKYTNIKKILVNDEESRKLVNLMNWLISNVVIPNEVGSVDNPQLQRAKLFYNLYFVPYVNDQIKQNSKLYKELIFSKSAERKQLIDNLLIGVGGIHIKQILGKEGIEWIYNQVELSIREFLLKFILNLRLSNLGWEYIPNYDEFLRWVKKTNWLTITLDEIVEQLSKLVDKTTGKLLMENITPNFPLQTNSQYNKELTISFLPILYEHYLSNSLNVIGELTPNFLLSASPDVMIHLYILGNLLTNKYGFYPIFHPFFEYNHFTTGLGVSPKVVKSKSVQQLIGNATFKQKIRNIYRTVVVELLKDFYNINNLEDLGKMNEFKVGGYLPLSFISYFRDYIKNNLISDNMLLVEYLPPTLPLIPITSNTQPNFTFNSIKTNFLFT